MDVSRAISNIHLPQDRRDGGNNYLVGRRNASATPDDARVEKVPSLGTLRDHSQGTVAAGNETAKAPDGLREIQATFTSNRQSDISPHTAYSAQFLAQQLAQQENSMTAADPATAHRRASFAYDNSLNLTVTVLGFDGHVARVA